MGDVVAVLVVPADGDPGGLLRRTKLRGEMLSGFLTWDPQPPTVTIYSDTRPRRDENALALWWNGALVPEGWDRASRCVPWTDPSAWVFEYRDPPKGVADVLLGAEAIVARHGGRVVRLARVDGRLAEVTP